MKFKNGFSLIELLVVVGIMGVLAAIGLASYRTANMKSRDARRAADIQQLRSALEMYRSSGTEIYPAVTCASNSTTCWSSLMTTLVTYLGGGQTIIDPLNRIAGGKTYVYTYTGTTIGYSLKYISEIDGLEKTFTNP